MWKQTAGEKRGSIDGIGLFFGALIGANLGTSDALVLGDYVELVIMLAATVAVLRIVSTSERRLYAYLTLAAYAAVVGYTLLGPDPLIASMPVADAQRLATTLAIWAGAVIAIEVWPVSEPALPPLTPPAA